MEGAVIQLRIIIEWWPFWQYISKDLLASFKTYCFMYVNHKPVVSIQTHFDKAVSWLTQLVKLHKNFFHFEYSMCVHKKNILGEYSSFLKSSMWNYLQLDWVNFYQNYFVSKRPVTCQPTDFINTN